MRTTTNSVPKTQPPTNQGYSASVPLSVYRELAAELQATQATMNLLSEQNQKLTQENQFLRQEITKAVKSIIELQKLTDPLASYNPELDTPANLNREINQINQPLNEPCPQANRTQNFSGSSPQKQKVSRPRKSSHSSAPKKQFRPEPTPKYFPLSEPVYFEEQEIRYYPSRKKEPSEANGWVLVIAIVLIIVTAFGAGYLVVRPLLQHRSK